MSHKNSIREPAISQYDVYNGGILKPINTENLLDNPIAIDQLLNDHNSLTKEIKNLQDENLQLKSELEFQRTSPFIAIFATFVNISGTIISGYGVNLLSTDKKTEGAWIIIIVGALLVIAGSLMTVLYRWVRGWFNQSVN